MANKFVFETEAELLTEARIQAFVHIGKRSENLEIALQDMPMEFWSLTMFEKDQVEARLKKYFKEER